MIKSILSVSIFLVFFGSLAIGGMFYPENIRQYAIKIDDKFKFPNIYRESLRDKGFNKILRVMGFFNLLILIMIIYSFVSQLFYFGLPK